MRKKTEGAARRISTWKKILFSAVVVVVFFASLEIVLALAGVRPMLFEEDPYVGFVSASPLYVEDQDPDGQTYLVTAPNKLLYFNSQRFPPTKPAGTYRIFTLGGSTPYGRPYDDTHSTSGWLRELLPEVDRSQQWEVINAGGISYASYRVARLMERLIEHSPDLFIVYSGHNEFLEQRTYGPLIKQARMLTDIALLLRRTRTFTALNSLLKDEGPSPASDGAPDADGSDVRAVILRLCLVGNCSSAGQPIRNYRPTASNNGSG